MEATRGGFNRLRKVVLETFKLKPEDIPTYYYITKFCPKIEQGIFQILNMFSFLIREYTLNKATTKSGKSSLNDIPKKNKVKKQYCGRIKCSLAKSLEHIFEKIERRLDDPMVFKKVDKLMVIFAADGARHQVTQEGDMNVISFNMLVINKELLSHDVTTTQSYNILTYQQIVTDKSDNVVLSAYQEMLEE